MKCSIQNTRHGSLIRDDYGRICLVTDIAYEGCPQTDDWVKAQDRPVTTAERKGHWLHTAPLDSGGAVCSPISRCELVLSQEQVADVLRNYLVEEVKGT